MADEMSKTQAPKRTNNGPRRGPMGGGRGGFGAPGEKPKDFKNTMLKLLAYVGKHKVAVIFAVIFAICSVIFNIIGPKVLGQVTTKLYEGLVAKVAGTGAVDFDWIGRTLTLLLGLYLASSACNLAQGWLMTGVTQKVCYRMRKEIAEKITRVPMSYFNGHSKGDVLSRITNDVDTLGQSLNQSVTQLITSVTQIVGVLVMMLSISLPLTGVVVVTLPVAAVIMGVMMHFSQPYFRAQQNVLGEVNGLIEEDFAGQNVIQVFDRADDAVAAFDEKNNQLFTSGWRSQFLSGLMMPLMSLVGNAGYVAVVVVGARLALAGNATPGDIQSFIQYVRNFTQPIQQIANVSNTMQSMAAATERVFEFLAAPEEENPAQPQVPTVREGRVEFDHVRFGYTPDKTIIHDFSCTAEPGQTVAIVGPTGAGKTTIIKLLQRFYDVDAGSLLVDGVDVRDMPLSQLRACLGYAPQKAFLFSGTVDSNVSFSDPAMDEGRKQLALDVAQASDFVGEREGGMEAPVSQGGANLSGGQRQRLAIARALAADARAYTFDDSFSALDYKTDALLRADLAQKLAGKTVVIVAQRIATVMGADRIVVLSEGAVVGCGTHAELLQSCPEYREIAASQLSADELEKGVGAHA